ncbi:hypothetical protein RRF57_013394 [Xylaria bambusicola]|uniref:Uncharacterized protein n=1 Tax=Xylaria bambusicola TaxID=326684 RepID=A0AAN7V589_9PEZI
MTRSADEFRPAQLQLDKPSTELSIQTTLKLVDYNVLTNPDALFYVQAVKKSASVAFDKPNGAELKAVPVTILQLRDAIIRCKDALSSAGLAVK